MSIGISLESQLIALMEFIKKKKTKTVLMYPKNEYQEIIEKKLKVNLAKKDI